jgi:hypothetical protein
MTIKRRRDMKVTFVSEVPADSDVHIVVADSRNGFELVFGDRLLATCPGAKKLSAYAFEEGAKSVRCDFHWGLADNEH